MYLSLITAVAMYGVVAGQGDPELGFESCSTKCSRDHVNSESEDLYKFPCSCTRSCSLYKDCCFDSAFRNEAWNISGKSTICLHVSSKGRFRAVGQCPPARNDTGVFCKDSIGHLPPVTSKTTGITYANIYCAACHDDGENLQTWKVELKCCSEHDDLLNSTGRKIIYRKGHLWSRVPGQRDCPCSYSLINNVSGFMDKLELRSCNQKMEISKCSSSWQDETVEQLCKSFLDPVYIEHKVYRNVHCAKCNFERSQNAKCMPNIVARKLSEGASISEVFEFCKQNELKICLYYLDSVKKGRGYAFSTLMNINVESCIPPHGRRCCEGERYDFRSKRCRTLTS